MTFDEQPAIAATRVRPMIAGEQVTFRSFYEHLERQPEARSALCEYLVSRAAEAIFWETPPCTLSSADRAFEFVWVPATHLAQARPDSRSFQEHFRADSARPVVVFQNLGGDATLVVPEGSGPSQNYAHLLSFLRNAPERQVHELLRTLGATFRETLSHEPIWVSTAGMGVPWLHIRLDSYPKYYRFREYKDEKWRASE